jgi:hypothetical protein
MSVRRSVPRRDTTSTYTAKPSVGQVDQRQNVIFGLLRDAMDATLLNQYGLRADRHQGSRNVSLSQTFTLLDIRSGSLSGCAVRFVIQTSTTTTTFLNYIYWVNYLTARLCLIA